MVSMLPLIPLAISILPSLARWLIGDSAAKTVTEVGAVVAGVTGVIDPTSAEGFAAVEAALAGKPELVGQIQVQLATLAAGKQAEADRAATEMAKVQFDTLAAHLGDTADARRSNNALIASGSKLAWSGAVVDAFVLMLFSGCVAILMFRGLPDTGLARDLMVGLMGTVSAMAVTIVQYHRGSSAGSAMKSTTIETQLSKTGP